MMAGFEALEGGRRRMKSFYWRVRAEIRRQVMKSSYKKQHSFHYDPFSYALNFDDGLSSYFY
ncbi:hypothetical protein J5N97_022877 [Dioscorea zingiberensis]|uniref:Uncharacterized protein n=1 Tax=Dioscorea zingiberensis TaxID=325984 RepID=A0A9D5CCU5_9LILI|nr:hypothetical protein J5N97_022865 [Dioscorea zingiberensis]KAJ0970000.1 hypothetical protein J5N97_022877 [Dioscorea zingiberensis]